MTSRSRARQDRSVLALTGVILEASSTQDERVTLGGELDLASRDQLTDLVRSAIKHAADRDTRCVVDMAAVTHVECAIFRRITELAAERAGTVVLIARPSPIVSLVLNASGYAASLPVVN
jgi:anti-anti-sigma factor